MSNKHLLSTCETPSESFDRLVKIMDELRAKCPWDQKQTIESIRHLSLEEVYELSDAILQGDNEEIKKELGDIMLHIVFYSKIASETQLFNITDVLNGICEKLIRRHPHIFGNVVVQNAQDVKDNWEKIKMKEGNKSALSGVPSSLPSMIKAYRIQEKAQGVGFDWEQPHQVWDKVQEELNEFHEEILQNDSPEKIEGEFGDLLFSLINYARFLNINPENALEKTNKKFISRFTYLEQKAQEQGKMLHEMSLSEMDVFWEEAKKQNH